MSKHNGMKGAELAQFQAELRQFCGTENWYRHPLNPRLVYTDGVQYLAEKAGAYWLIDVVASVQHTEPQLARHSFQSWKLTVDTEKATGLVECTDGNNTPLYSQADRIHRLSVAGNQAVLLRRRQAARAHADQRILTPTPRSPPGVIGGHFTHERK